MMFSHSVCNSSHIMLSIPLLAICCLLSTIGEQHHYTDAFSIDTTTQYVHHAITKKRFTVHRHHPSKQSDLTDWVIENLEDNGSITSADAVKAGEGDTLPRDGLVVGKCRIFAAAADQSNYDDELYPIYLYLGRNGWGTGVHPTTRLCLEWLGDYGVKDGDILLDYGCGSGILSIAALHFGASRCIGVDVEAEALVTAERNMELNGWAGRFQGLHTREVLPYGLFPPRGASLCIANILIGQLVRPSMVAALVTNLEDGGLLCLSGIRPGEVDSLKETYTGFEWLDDQYAELSASETTNSIESYGFDCGRWARLVGRKMAENDSFIQQMSELAVS
ncbi:hypothetical protein ACHAXM_003619 [Skeletonema potamos]